MSGPANPITITLAVRESDKRFLNLGSTQLVITEAGGTAMANITAVDDEVVNLIPARVALSIAGDNTILLHTRAISVNIKDNDSYAIGFEEEEITLREGMSTNVRLSISPTPVGANTAPVALSPSDGRQLTVRPARVVFSAARAGFDVTVNVTEDAIPESEKTFTVRPEPLGIPATVSTELSVIAPADNDTTMVRVFAGRAVIPEGATAFISIEADINRDMTVSPTRLTGDQTSVIFSPSSLTLGPHNRSASFNILVADNGETQTDNRTFTVDLSAAPDIQALPSFTFTVPPNDLAARAATRVEFALESREATQSMTIDIAPMHQDAKASLSSPKIPASSSTPVSSPLTAAPPSPLSWR